MCISNVICNSKKLRTLHVMDYSTPADRLMGHVTRLVYKGENTSIKVPPPSGRTVVWELHVGFFQDFCTQNFTF